MSTPTNDSAQTLALRKDMLQLRGAAERAELILAISDLRTSAAPLAGAAQRVSRVALFLGGASESGRLVQLIRLVIKNRWAMPFIAAALGRIRRRRGSSRVGLALGVALAAGIWLARRRRASPDPADDDSLDGVGVHD